MEAVVGAPALRPFALWARPIEKERAIGRNEAHAGMGVGERLEICGDADRLEDPHHFAIEMHRPRQVIGGGLALQDQRFQAAGAQQMGKGRAGRAVADNGDVEPLHHLPLWRDSSPYSHGHSTIGGARRPLAAASRRISRRRLRPLSSLR